MTAEEFRNTIKSELTQSEIDETFGIFPPFYTDCGINIHIGKAGECRLCRSSYKKDKRYIRWEITPL